jgi:hypothetical protein
LRHRQVAWNFPRVPSMNSAKPPTRSVGGLLF